LNDQKRGSISQYNPFFDRFNRGALAQPNPKI